MDFISYKAFVSLLLPPLDLIVLGAVGLLMLPVRRKAGMVLIASSLAGLFVLSIPVVATSLASLLERGAGHATNAGGAQAIVILGGGSYADAPEYGADTVSAMTLERVRWGARLHRELKLPVLVTGGAPRSTRTSEAAQMKAALVRDFGAEVKWLDEKSLTTFESARNTKEMLSGAGIDRILLVTHALHMRRARLAYERAGFHVTDSATGYSTAQPSGILDYLPSAQALELSRGVLHEVIGLGWYHLRLAAMDRQKDAK